MAATYSIATAVSSRFFLRILTVGSVRVEAMREEISDDGVAQSLTLRMGMAILVVVARCAEQHPRVLVRL